MEKEILLLQNSHGLGRQGYLAKEWHNAMIALEQNMAHELYGLISSVEVEPCLYLTRSVQLSILMKDSSIQKRAPLCTHSL